MASVRRKVAIIGAGESGLPAIKNCLDEGLEPTCFERSDDIGGLWTYREAVEDGYAIVMSSTVINSSKEMTAYSDFPPPAHFPNYMPHYKVKEYLGEYASKHQLRTHIRFQTEVLQIIRAPDYGQTGQWKVTWRDRTNRKETQELYDAICICTGHHGKKSEPHIEGQEEFQGQKLHTHDFRHSDNYGNKTVLVIGIGNSGGDIAVHLSRIAKKVYLSTRRGSWVVPSNGDDGLPGDIAYVRRVGALLRGAFPNFVNAMAERACNKRFNHINFGLKPAHRFDAQHPMVNDDLPNRISCGSIVIKPDVSRLTAHGVAFTDQSAVEDLDVVILATGYKIQYPCLEEGVVSVQNNQVELYSYVFPPRLEHPTLAIIGCIQPVGASISLSEMQTRWVARVFKGVSPLPPVEVMLEDITLKRRRMADRYVASPRHTIQVDYIPYMDELATHIGCKPKLGEMFWTDPQLALQCFFGPCTAYQYRLQGPHPWAGAREAIMSTMERVVKPTRTREPPEKLVSGTGHWIYIIVVLLLALIVCLALY